MAVRLEFETTDSQEIELAKRYWAMDEEGAYLERVADLLPFREITQASMVAMRISEHRDRPFRLIVTAHFANA
ncbi:hypothetical protein FA415_33695 [Pseudomonas aeruginosa]|nr:hypothetical protein [Pseudomonas aeruginosa]